MGMKCSGSAQGRRELLPRPVSVHLSVQVWEHGVAPAVCPGELTLTVVLSIHPGWRDRYQVIWCFPSNSGLKQAGFVVQFCMSAQGVRLVMGHGLMKLVTNLLLCRPGQVQCFLSSFLTLLHNLDCL